MVTLESPAFFAICAIAHGMDQLPDLQTHQTTIQSPEQRGHMVKCCSDEVSWGFAYLVGQCFTIRFAPRQMSHFPAKNEGVNVQQAFLIYTEPHRYVWSLLEDPES